MVKARVSIDRSKKVVFHQHTDGRLVRSEIPRKLRVRLIRNAIVVSTFPAFALYFQQIPVFWFSLVWAIGITWLQASAYRRSPESFLGDELSATRLYGKRRLIVVAVFWALLIAASSVVLYLRKF
jgi:hypothetical protein